MIEFDQVHNTVPELEGIRSNTNIREGIGRERLKNFFAIPFASLVEKQISKYFGTFVALKF